MNVEELHRAFSLMNFDISKDDMRILANYLDKNGDKYVNYMEFLDWIEDPNYSKVIFAAFSLCCSYLAFYVPPTTQLCLYVLLLAFVHTLSRLR